MRCVNGVLLLNKHSAISSNLALQKMKRLFQAAKAGHTGSLDPLATGMLPICFGEATKFSHFLLDADKEYQVIAKLGETTTTGDTEGSVVERFPLKKISKENLLSVLNQFKGPGTQIPPMFSALKHQGKPLYELARKGMTIERPARAINIYDLQLLSFSDEQLTLRVKCSKGTYIRTLVEDIGKALVGGAHVICLHRRSFANFCEEQMITVDELEKVVSTEGLEALDRYLLPVDCMLAALPSITFIDTHVRLFRQGQIVQASHNLNEGWVKLLDETHEFIGLGEVLEDKKIAPRRLLNYVNTGFPQRT